MVDPCTIVLVVASPLVFIENFPCHNQRKKFLPLKRWKPLRPNLTKPSLKFGSLYISAVF